ncbi:MAG TPA: ABC transporter permease [Thermomicrobiales bacterium]|nr:ABC transporter permease [Thermomicrobiales bacterium]
MLQFVVRRVLIAIPTLFAISVVSFILIQLPPGDFLTTYAANLAAQGEGSDTVNKQLEALRDAYGLNQPVYVQYYKWISRIVLHGDFGQSLEWQLPVSQLLWDRMGATLVLTVTTLLFTWLLAIPIGVYSATHQYSAGDYLFTALAFVGLGIPSFMIALVLMWVAFRYLGMDVGGLFSPQYRGAPWSVGKALDLLGHFWIPLVIIGLEGTAGLIRTMRANLLDELNKPYVIAARARGVSERTLIWEYPVRVALNPFVSSAGFALPGLISGATIVGIVLSLPIFSPMLYQALVSQDMYLAGAFILLIGALTIIGMLISDIVLAWLDPRIRYS